MAAHGFYSEDRVLGFFDDYACETESEVSDCDSDDCETAVEDFSVIKTPSLPISASFNKDLENSAIVPKVSSYCSNGTSVEIISDVNTSMHMTHDLTYGCSCKNKCYSLFDQESLANIQLDCLELTTQELDLVITAKLQALTNNSPLTSSNKAVAKQRKLSQTNYYHEGRPVCRDFFMKIHLIGKDRLGNLLKHLKSNGLTVRSKRSGGRKCNSRAFSHEVTSNVFSFVSNFAEQHGIKLPGRIPGYKNYDLALLPSHMTKDSVYNIYKESVHEASSTVGLSSFKRLWKELLPFVIISKPATDLCWTCQKNNNLISR